MLPCILTFTMILSPVLGKAFAFILSCAILKYNIGFRHRNILRIPKISMFSTDKLIDPEVNVVTSDKTASLTWPIVTNAKSYRFEYSNMDINCSFNLMTTSTPSITLTNLQPHAKYNYTIVALSDLSSSELYKGLFQVVNTSLIDLTQRTRTYL